MKTASDQNWEEALRVVADYLCRFYRNEPDDTVAATNAIYGLAGRTADEWRVAEAFRAVLTGEPPAGTLREVVQRSGNRGVQSDEEARVFLEEVYRGNDLWAAIEIDEDPA